jgi:hypothetical protein
MRVRIELFSFTEMELNGMECDGESRISMKGESDTSSATGTEGVDRFFAELLSWLGFLSRSTSLLLAATETTGKMPGGKVRLIHGRQYMPIRKKVR